MAAEATVVDQHSLLRMMALLVLLQLSYNPLADQFESSGRRKDSGKHNLHS